MGKTISLAKKGQQTPQEAPQPQISTASLADVVELTKTLETPYLRDLQKVITNELESRAKLERNEAVFRIQKIAHDLGMTVEELVSTTAGKVRQPREKKLGSAPAKYRNQTTGQTWSGRGLKPKWIKEWEERHGNLDALKIKEA